MLALEARISGAGYGGTRILKGVSLRVGEGEVLAVVGRSGAGKTTLMLSVTGVLDHLMEGWTEGEVRLGNLDPLGEGFREVPRKVGIVLQDPDRQIAMPYVIDEVAFTLRNLGLPQHRAWSALLRFGLAHKAYAETESLSGGEKRRLTLAASLVHDPEILILDEPSASVDPWGVGDLKRYISTAAEKGLTVLLIEHKLGFFRGVFDRVVLIEDGKSVWEARSPGIEREPLERRGVDFSLRGRRRPPSDKGGVVLRVGDCHFSYDGFELETGTFELREGERVALIGPNGGGKTTLLRILGGLARCEGEISIDGRAFYVPQHPDYLFIRPTVEAELKDAARRGGGRPLRLPEGVGPGMSPYRLSHGQRRWLSLSVAHAYKPKVLLLDEPTTGLDLFLVERLMDTLWELSRSGVTVVFSTHDPRAVHSLADRVFLVHRGRVSEMEVGDAVSTMLEAIGTEA